MKKITIMCDSSADISPSKADALGIHVLRIPLRIDGEECKDEVTITFPELIEKIRAGASVKTSQPIIGELLGMRYDLLKEYDEIFYIPLAKGLSGTCRTALTLAEDYQGKVILWNQFLFVLLSFIC